ncbi:MAG: hypothetical protein PVG49_04270 [Desulfobacteraceae bacterium]|jgi:hypothetical protein
MCDQDEQGVDVYLLKIYRRKPNSPHSMVGTLEEINSLEKRSFKNSEELMRLLSGRNRCKKKDH